jgi:hypothetical protein
MLDALGGPLAAGGGTRAHLMIRACNVPEPVCPFGLCPMIGVT